MTDDETPAPEAPAGRLTKGPVRGHLSAMTMPMVWGILSIILFNLADTYFVGQLGTAELAAMSFTFPVTFFFVSIAIGLAAGASSVVARMIGEGDRQRVRRHATDSLLLALVTVLIFGSIGYLTIDPLFTAMGATPDSLPLIRDYMEIWYLGMIFIVIPMVGNGVLRATGDSKFPSYVMMTAAGINLILDPILIFGLFGAPRLEIEGAALATVIANAGTLIAGLYVLHGRERLLTVRIGSLQMLARSWGRVMHVGLPAALTNTVTPAATAVITALIARHGDAAVAGFGVAARIEALALIVMFAMSSVVGPIAGQNWGGGLYGRVRELLRLVFKFSMIYGLGVALVLAAVAPVITAAFNDDPAVQQVATLYLWIVPVSLALYGFQFNVAAIFNGIGMPLYGVVLSVLRMLVLYIPLAWTLGHFHGVNGVFAAAFIANLGCGTAAWILCGRRAKLWLWRQS